MNVGRKVFRVGIFGALTLAVSACGVMWYDSILKSSHILHICNGLHAPIRLVVDGQEITVPPREIVPHSVAGGSHSFQVLDPKNAEEQGKFEVSSTFLGRLAKRTVYVLNPTRSSVIVHSEATYSVRPEDSSVQNAYHLGRRYMQVEGVDYIFKVLPDNVIIKRGQTKRVFAVSMLTEEPAVLTAWLSRKVAPEQLFSYAERHLAAGDTSRDLLRSYLVQLGLHQEYDRGFEFLRAGIDRRPLELEWHRAYQTLGQRTNQTKTILGEYTKLAEQYPNDSMVLYLRGRVDADIEVANSYFERSIVADSNNAYPLYAMCQQHRSRGRYEEAKLAVEAALKLDPDNREMDESLFQVRLALGEAATLERELNIKLQKQPTSYHLHTALLMSLSLQTKLDEARKRQDLFAIRIKQDLPEDPFDLASGSDRFMAYLDGDFERMLSVSQTIKQPKLKEVLVFESLVELGRTELLETTQFADHAPQRGYQKLTIALAHWLKGQGDRFDHWFEAAMVDFKQGDYETELLAKTFEASEPDVVVRQLDRIALQGDERVLVSLVAAVRTPFASRAPFIERAEILNRVPNYPHKFVERVIQRLRTP